MTRKRGTVFQWLAGLVSHSSNQMDMEWDEDDKMLHLGTPVPVILSGNLNTAGTIQPNSATGTVPVTEASAATIVTYQKSIANATSASMNLTGAALPASADSVAFDNARHRIYTVNIPIAAGGAVTNIALHATLAGYKFHFKVLGMWSSVGDATTTWWFHTTAGAVSCVGCPATPGFNVDLTNADTMYNALNGAYMNNNAATGDVTLLDVAGVAAGAANLYVFLEGWFETT